MSLLETIASKVGARWLRQKLEGNKEIAIWLSAVVIASAAFFDLPIACDLKQNPGDAAALSLAIVSGAMAAHRAFLNRSGGS